MGKVVSICIPIYNQIKFVDSLVQSIKLNQNKKVEFIICDNNSTDGTYEVLSKNKKYFKLFRNKKNLGFLKNFLKTIKLSSSEYVTFAGGDVHLVPTCFYEFAQRYRDQQGKIFHGFIEGNADKIFESK